MAAPYCTSLSLLLELLLRPQLVGVPTLLLATIGCSGRKTGLRIQINTSQSTDRLAFERMGTL